jgi:eukaryotic-like serine/threonine-protein kinase
MGWVGMKNHVLGQDFFVGQVLGHYRILERVGEGGMGVVYRARDEHLDCDVAIKLLPHGSVHDDSTRKRFHQEARALSRLNHPNIAIVHDFDTKEGVDFLVMEYIPGTKLTELLARGPLPEKEVIRLGTQLAEGLSAAHEKGVVHRDLKPGNLRLTADGRLKILDFGLAKLRFPATEGALTETLTETPTAAGTLPYMAPEQLLAGECDARTDLHAVGTILYEMATGHRPFDEVERSQLIGAIIRRLPITPTVLNPKLSPELEWIVGKCLEKEPENRYQSAKELLVDLRRLSKEDSFHTHRLPPPPRRRSKIVWAVALALVLALASVIVYRYVISPPRTERVRVAVLPFSNRTGDKHLEELADVLTLTLLHDLSGSPDIRVLPYERLMEITGGVKAAGKDPSSSEAARILAASSGSQFIILPTIFRIGDLFRIDAEIRDVRTGETIATTKFERPLSRSPEETLYSMIGGVGNGVQNQFKKGWLGGQKLETSRTRNVSAAFHWEDGTKAMAQGNYALALDAFNQAVSDDPEFALGYAWMGKIYGILGYDAKALELSEKAAQKIAGQTPAIDAYFIEANLAERKYDYAAAEAKYLELIRLYPDDPTWHDNLAMVYEKQGKLKEAIARESVAIGKDPQYITAYRNLGTFYNRVNEYSQAVENAQKAIDRSRALGNQEGEAEALCVLGTSLWQMGKNSEAEADFRAALAIFESLSNEPGIARAHKLLGDKYAVEGKLDDALRFYQQSVSRSQEVQNNRITGVALMNMGSIYSMQGKYSLAADHYGRSLEAVKKFRDDRRRAELLSNYGGLLINHSTNPAQGAQYVQEALTLFVKSGDKGFEAFGNMLSGIYHCNSGQYSQAMNELSRASTLAIGADAKTDVVSITYNLGRCQFLQNQYEAARTSAQQSLELARGLNSGYDIPRAELLLGRIDLRMGDFKKAGTILTAALNNTADNNYKDLFPDAYTALAELRYEERQIGEAERLSRLAAGLLTTEAADPSNIEGRILLGLVRADRGNFAQALSDCQAALTQAEKMERASLQRQARLCLARVQLSQRKFAGALDALGDISSMDELAIGPELLARSCYVQSQALLGLGRSDDAKRAYERARDIIRRMQQTIPVDRRASFAERRELQVLLH